ncbi:MAG: ATP-binding protein [Thermodesulfobacteriota bacterium]
MALQSWWQVTTPHKDIREGKMSEAIFAADLGDVVYGKAPLEYKDASTFFQKTYLTQGLKNLLENVLSRLSGGKGDPVIQLQTPFGGGKTHALLALYHVIKHRKDIEHLPAISEFPKVKNAKVAVFVGTHADAVLGKTPWGEIAEQLGVYEIIKEHDKKRIAPGKQILRKIFQVSGPTLILMDEILEYIVKANRAEKVERITQGQTLAFLQEISEVVASSEDCCLVLTLPASILERYDEEAERSLQQLQKISGRVEAVYTPVEGVELYEVIRKRLFDNFGDEKTRKNVAQSYFDLYQKLGADVPSEVKEIEYRERIERAYPFHPELIDVLYERWGSYPTFQRTRGVLRLLAEVVADLYTHKVVSPLIQSSLVNLGNQTIRREFIKHIGNEFEAVIASDIASQNAKAPKTDKEMGTEYKKYNISEGIATSVFLYSFSAGASKETTLPRIRVALLREGIPTTIVGDAVAKLEEQLWYFHSEKNQYAFRNQPNLNRVIVDREETILDDRIREELKNLIQKNAGRALEVYLWPESPSDIPDNKNLKLAILGSSFSYDSEKGKSLTTELFEKAGAGFRVYKNTLFTLLVDDNHYVSLSKGLRRLLALMEVQNDKSLLEILTKQSHEELKNKFKDMEKEIQFRILTAYRYLALLEAGGTSWKDLGIPTVGSNQTISERVKQYLKDQERLLAHLTPKYLLDKAFSKEDNEKSLRDIYELHLKTPGMPIPESERVLIDTVKEGIKNGALGVQEGPEIYYKQDFVPNIDSTVLRGEIAEQKKGEKDKIPQPLPETQPSQPPSPTHTPGVVKRIYLRAVVPWDKLSELVRGVISPLKDKGSPPEITIEIRAESEKGFDRTTLDSKVQETLRQIGAKTEEWKEE